MRSSAPIPLRAAALAAALGLIALSGSAFGQGGVNGSIVGAVFDQTGLPIKGVKISAKSDTQIGGVKVVYTNDEGNFRIVGLQPGVFEVAAAAPKLKTVLQRDVKVGVGAPAEVTLIMEVETQVEEVKIIEKAPIVSTTTANVKEVYDEEFVDNLPVEWKTAVESFVGHNVPGAVSTGVRTARIRGGNEYQNAFNVEGFYMNGQKVTAKSLAAMEVHTAGYGAENAHVPGGVVNMVSKSGSNKYEFDVGGFVEDSNLRFFTDESDSETHNWNYFVNPAVSGPILKDRLWFYLNTESRSESSAREKSLSGFDIIGDPARRSYLNTRASLKLTWQVTTRNKLSTYSNVNRDWSRNNQDAFSYERDAQSKTDHYDFFHGVIWESLLKDNLFMRSQVGYQQFWEEEQPIRCETQPLDCDHIPQIRSTFPKSVSLQNFHEHEQRIRRSTEIINQLDWFANSKLTGEHNIKLRSRVFFQLFESALSTPGDHYVQLRAGGEPERARYYFTNDPRQESARFGWRIRGTSGLTTVHSVTDSMRLTRYLTFNPGVAFTTAHAANVGSEADLSGGVMTPHVSVAWDATHDGRTALRASFNNYVDTDALRLSRFALGDRVYKECEYTSGSDPEDWVFNSNCRYGGGFSRRTFGLPCGPDGVNLDGTSCREKLSVPRTWEYTTGAEREIIQGVGVGADVIYRLYTYPYEQRETNRVWGPSGYTLVPGASYRNGRSETVTDLGTPPAARRRYLSMTASIKRREGALRLTAAYTWTRMVGNVSNDDTNEFGENPVRDLYYLWGPLSQDVRHNIKSAAVYQMTKWLSTGVTWRYHSGRPFSRRFRNDVEGGFSDYRASIGTDPGQNINDPSDDRPLRLPDIMEFNLQLRANLKPLTGQQVELAIDAINLLALRSTTGVSTENDGPAFGRPGGRMGPMRVRLNARYRY